MKSNPLLDLQTLGESIWDDNRGYEPVLIKELIYRLT